LVNGRYEAIQPTAPGRLWSEVLNLYLGIHNGQLRYFTTNGELVPTPTEEALQAQQQALEAEQRVTRLAEQLQALGFEPEV
jgi:hypothetical protein